MRSWPPVRWHKTIFARNCAPISASVEERIHRNPAHGCNRRCKRGVQHTHPGHSYGAIASQMGTQHHSPAHTWPVLANSHHKLPRRTAYPIWSGRPCEQAGGTCLRTKMEPCKALHGAIPTPPGRCRRNCGRELKHTPIVHHTCCRTPACLRHSYCRCELCAHTFRHTCRGLHRRRHHAQHRCDSTNWGRASGNLGRTRPGNETRLRNTVPKQASLLSLSRKGPLEACTSSSDLCRTHTELPGGAIHEDTD